MVKAIRVHEHGGPEALRWEEVEVGEPGEGEIRMKNTAIGVNFVDVYMRKGVFRVLPSLPFTLGERGVRRRGDRRGPRDGGRRRGRRRGMPHGHGRLRGGADRPGRRGDPDPGVGGPQDGGGRDGEGPDGAHAVCQWARALGATVIGAVSSEAKAAQACLDVCHHVVVYAGAQEEEEDFVGKVKAIASGTGGGGGGVDVVYDGVGKDTWRASLACLAPRGCLVWFGESSGAPEPVAPRDLKARSLSVTCPSLRSYVATREALLAAAGEVWEKVASGVLRAPVGHVYSLAEAARAHADLESRRTSGSVVLVPSV
ncbi:hypothetical protein ACP70R_013063 [Stipagrostis hirtigluma subsp. patula]